MNVVTLAAFDDELIKIAYTHEQLYNMARGDLQMPEANAQKYVQEHQHLITGKPNTQQLSSGGTGVVAAPVPSKSRLGPPVPDSTGVVAPPKAPAPSGITGTHVRPETLNNRLPAAHVPTAPHPVAVPGGFGKMVGKGTAALKAHAVPLAVGAGVATAGALALNHMRKKRDAASR